MLTLDFVQIPRKKAPLAEDRGVGVPPAVRGGQRLVPDDNDDQIVILD